MLGRHGIRTKKVDDQFSTAHREQEVGSKTLKPHPLLPARLYHCQTKIKKTELNQVSNGPEVICLAQGWSLQLLAPKDRDCGPDLSQFES